MRIQEFTANSLMFAIAHGYDVVWRKFNAKLKATGCNLTEALVLIAVYFEPQQEAQPSALAVALRTSRGNISHCLAKLSLQKHIVRTLDELDARRLIIRLTPSGRRLAQQLIAEVEQIEVHCEDHLAALDPKPVVKALFTLGSALPRAPRPTKPRA